MTRIRRAKLFLRRRRHESFASAFQTELAALYDDSAREQSPFRPLNSRSPPCSKRTPAPPSIAGGGGRTGDRPTTLLLTAGIERGSELAGSFVVPPAVLGSGNREDEPTDAARGAILARCRRARETKLPLSPWKATNDR